MYEYRIVLDVIGPLPFTYTYEQAIDALARFTEEGDRGTIERRRLVPWEPVVEEETHE